jgi:hypothetical protein
MRQQTLAMQGGFEKFGWKSKRELFLEEMDKIVPWAGLVGLIEPHYPKGEQGRPPVCLERMLRLYFLQQWFNLSDPGLEDALYESPVLRLFAGIDLGREPAPDETTILHFRHLLEKHDLGRSMLKMVNEYLALCGGADFDWNHRGCNTYPRSQFDQERAGQARPGDASGKEGQPVVFRHEGPCRRGFEARHRAFGGSHGS